MAGQGEIEPGVILERLTSLDEGQSEIKAIVECLGKDFQAFQRLYIGDHVMLVNRADAAHIRLDRLEPRVESLDKAIQPIITMNKWMGWIAAAIGVLIFGLLFSIFTNQVQLIFP